MMNKNVNLRECIEKSFAISAPCLLPTALEQVAREKEGLLARMGDGELVKVPIVGDFSAGKSSLVNCLMGDRTADGNDALLPVNITPETAIAYEIYAAGVDGQQEEQVVLYREDKEIWRTSLAALKTMSTHPGDVAKVYVKSPKIAALQQKGLVLVDMPGIDSGIQEHNDAILHYIDKGTAYVLLVDAGQGALRTSTLTFLQELSKYNLSPALFVSKMEKKPEGEVAKIKDYIGWQAKAAVGSDVFVGGVSAHEHRIEDFVKYLDGIDVQYLVKQRMAPQVIAFIDKQINYMNMQGDLLQANIQDAEEKIKQLEQEKRRVESSLKMNTQADSPEKSTQDILDLVKEELMKHTEEVATMLVSGVDQKEINACLLNYIRPVLVMAFKEEGRQYAEALNTVVDDVSKSLQEALDIEKGMLDGIIDDLHEEIVGGLSALADMLLRMPHAWAKILGMVLQLISSLIPDFLKSLFGSSMADKVSDVEEKLRSMVVRKIVEGLRRYVYEQVVAQQKRIREHVQLNMEKSIGNMQDSVRHSSENVSGKTELEGKLKQLNAAVAELENIKATIR